MTGAAAAHGAGEEARPIAKRGRESHTRTLAFVGSSLERLGNGSRRMAICGQRRNLAEE